MTIQLCQECCQWVWSRTDRCPECQDALDRTADPDEIAQRIRPIIGDVVQRIGHVRIPRKRLPHDGVLYQTTNGLFFLPYQTVTATRMVEVSAGSPMWTIAALLWAPLMFVLPFIKGKRITEKQFQESEPVRLEEKDLHLLPDLLPRLPGAFFAPMRDMLSIRRKRNGWKVARMNRTSMYLEPLAGAAFGLRMEDLLQSDLWSSLADQS